MLLPEGEMEARQKQREIALNSGYLKKKNT